MDSKDLKFMEGKTIRMGAGGRPPEPIEKRFKEKLNSPNERGCKLWNGGTSKHTSSDTVVGHIWFEGRAQTSHKIMWILSRGEPPSKQIQPSVCKNYLCMTPEHWRETPDYSSKKSMEEIRAEAGIRRDLKAKEKFIKEKRKERKENDRERKKNRLMGRNLSPTPPAKMEFKLRDDLTEEEAAIIADLRRRGVIKE